MIYLDRFSTLDELKPSQRKDARAVLAVLAKVGKFSVFEATQHASLARTLDAIVKAGLMATDSESIGFPWTRVTITEAGAALLAEER